MRTVEAQQELLTAHAVVPEPVRMSITEALGLLSAEEVTATVALPGFAQAAIDGYAVRSVDVGGIAPVGAHPAPLPERLPVVGEVPAGSQQPVRLQPGQAVRIHTGAPLPNFADAVLPLDWSDRGVEQVRPSQPVRPGGFVRQIGDDIQPGDVAVPLHTILSPAHIALLAAAGHNKVLVHPRPRVSILTVGKEFVDIDRVPGPGQVFDTVSYALAAAASEAGAEVHRVGIVQGEPARLADIIDTQLLRSELLVIAGAVGGKDADEFRELLGDIDTTRVAMHPGSVQGFGLVGDSQTPCIVVPANPIAALVIFEVMVRPLIRAGLGKAAVQRRTVVARSVREVRSTVGRRGYIRARLMRDMQTQDYLVEGLAGATGAPSHLLAGLAEANAYMIIPAEVERVRPGDEVEVLFLGA
ncbi:MAG: molybdopterin molybdotransferase MoeA [Corynebacterium sp.]|nr:molybdopterin molybdotransferase MoeA [Corynebacterium sp.]